MDLNIIKQHKIWSDAFVYITEVSHSNSLPYHNIKHVIDVFKNCYNLSFYEEVSDKSVIELCLAALFHDFNHSGGKLPDSENITNALLGLDGFFIVHKKYNDEVNKENISNIIKATQYPYVIADSDLSIEQKIIRDADMLQTFEDDWIGMVMFGLRTEFKKTMPEMIKIQIGFLEKMHFYTKWANDRYLSFQSKNLTDLQILSSFYQKEDNKYSFLIKTDSVDAIKDLSPMNISNDIWTVFTEVKLSLVEITKMLYERGLKDFEIKLNDSSKAKED